MSDANDDPADRMRQLNRRAAEQRAALMDDMALARARTRPTRLAQDAGNKLLDTALDLLDRGKASVRAHPATTLGVAAAIGAVLARRPLFGLLTAGWAAGLRRIKSKSREQDAQEDEK